MKSVYKFLIGAGIWFASYGYMIKQVFEDYTKKNIAQFSAGYIAGTSGLLLMRKGGKGIKKESKIEKELNSQENIR